MSAAATTADIFGISDGGGFGKQREDEEASEEP